MKGGNPEDAVNIFQRMKRDHCEATAETYTLMINLYGKVKSCMPNIYFYANFLAFKIIRHFMQLRKLKCIEHYSYLELNIKF